MLYSLEEKTLELRHVLLILLNLNSHWHSNLGLFLNKFDPEGFLAEHKEWCADPQAVTNISLD